MIHHGGMTSSGKTDRDGPALLAIYLNDHLGGSTGGRELARRTARAHRGTPAGGPLQRLAAEIAEDRRALLGIMGALGVEVQRHKVAVGWAVEKAARLKLNGRLLRRSPLSSVVELESLRLGIEGKTSGWVTLRAVADHDPRLDAAALDRLLERARAQADTVEELRLQAADEAFGP